MSKFGAAFMVADMETSAALGLAEQGRTEYGDMPVRRSVANDHALGARKFTFRAFCLVFWGFCVRRPLLGTGGENKGLGGCSRRVVDRKSVV